MAADTPAATHLEEIDKRLVEALNPALVEILKDGPARGSPFLPTWRCIDQANRIFGRGGWSYRVVSPPEMVREFEGRNSPRHLYRATVEVTARGRSATDVGTNTTASDTPQGHEMSIKGCVSDGMRRALRTWGEQFGNSLYDKEERPTAQDVEQARAEREAEPADGPDLDKPIEVPQKVLDAGAPPIDAPWTSYEGMMMWAAALCVGHGIPHPSEREIMDLIGIAEEREIETEADVRDVGADRVREIIVRHATGDEISDLPF